MLRVASAEPADDAVVDLLVGELHPVVLAHERRPLHGAGAHDHGLVLGPPVAAMGDGEFVAHVVPHLFGLEEHAVKVEDDRVDAHAAA